MTNEEINKLVAEKVMEWNVNFMSARDPHCRGEKRLHWRDDKNGTMYLPDQWQPSEDDSNAMEVVEHILEKWGTYVRIEGCAHSPEDGVLWNVRFKNTNGLDEEADDYSRNRGICVAALKTVGIKVK